MRRSMLLALLLLALAGGLRLWAAEHARFTGDEADYWAKSRRVATLEYTPIFGPEITGSAAHLPGPAYYYLMAAPQLLSASPRAGSTFVVLLHLLSGWLLFLLAREARSGRAGLVALVLFAFSPWEVLYADRIWGSCVVPAWGALTFFAAHRARSSGIWQGVLLFLALVLPQLHLSVPVLWLACGALLVLRPPERIHWRAIAVALVLVVLAYGGPILSELRTGFANTESILAHGGGKEAWDYASGNPLRVLGYMVLYGSGEIGYHFARGYWGGGFDSAEAYLTVAGWGRFFSRHGALLGGLGVASILLALFGWLDSLRGAATEMVAAARARRRDLVSLDRALSIALFVGFLGGGLLLLLARKRFFPHYANILVPMALWPIAAGIDAALDHRRRRVVAGLALAGSAAFMVSSTVRYYREIDSLNGLDATLEMVEAVLEDGAPSRVRFTHFDNRYAWSQVANVRYGRPLAHDARGRVQWIVHNRAPWTKPLPEGGRRFGAAMLQRVPPEGVPSVPASEVVRSWRRFEVEATHPDGRVRGCRPSGEQCRYGDQPWEHFGPEDMEVGGRTRRLLFMHPIQGGEVRARYPVAAEKTQVVLRYALSDGACASNNRATVDVELREADALLGMVAASNRRGLHTATFTRTSTEAGAIEVRIRTENAGARIFGFDLEVR